MTYDERLVLIKEWFVRDIASRFSTPNGIDPKIAASDTIEAVNSYIPASVTHETMGQLLASITRELARSARSRTLPTVRDFIAATSDAAQKRTDARTITTRTETIPPYLRITVARIRAGDAISDTWLRGSMREELLSMTDITEKDLEPYEKYLASAAHKQ